MIPRRLRLARITPESYAFQMARLRNSTAAMQMTAGWNVANAMAGLASTYRSIT